MFTFIATSCSICFYSQNMSLSVGSCPGRGLWLGSWMNSSDLDCSIPRRHDLLPLFSLAGQVVKTPPASAADFKCPVCFLVSFSAILGSSVLSVTRCPSAYLCFFRNRRWYTDTILWLLNVCPQLFIVGGWDDTLSSTFMSEEWSWFFLVLLVSSFVYFCGDLGRFKT